MNSHSPFSANVKETLFRLFPHPQFTRLRNKKLYDWMNKNAPNKKVLNLGSGVGNFDKYLDSTIKTINVDLNPQNSLLHSVADAHFLPFKDESIDIVYSIAVLEHVKKPWIVADEITRILRKGGYVVLELPFLNVIHDEHDYFRFTDKGIQSLFSEDTYEVILTQVGSGGGSFLSVFFLYYFKQIFPTNFLQTLWFILMAYPASLLKYIDLLTKKSRDLRLTANSFSFIGRKK